MAIADLLAKLVEMKNQLAANLNSMGVAASESEKLNTLVPKVLEVKGEQNVEWVDDVSEFTIRGAYDMNHTYAGYSNINRIVKKLELPEGLNSIGKYSFIFSTFTSITIPDSVTKIDEQAFAYCGHLESITIPDKVTLIGSYAFYACISLESVIIPESMTAIKECAFSKCTNLAHIYYKGTEEQWNAITKGTSWSLDMGSNVSGGTTIHYNYVPE